MQRSFVVLEHSIYPLFLPHYVVRFVPVDELSASLALDEIALRAQAVFLLEEVSLLHVHIPSAFVYLFAALIDVSSAAVLFAVTEGAFKSIAVGIGDSSLAMNLVIVEAANVLERVSPFAESEPALSFFLSSHKFSLVHVSVAVSQHSFPVEFAALELSLEGLVLVYIFSRPHFLILSKLSLVNSSVCLFEHSMSLLLPMRKMALILSIILEVMQFSEPMELICVKLSFVLRHSLQKILALALLHSLQEASLVAQAGIGLEGSTLEVILLELSCELVPIGEVKLAVAAMFLAIDHGALEL